MNHFPSPAFLDLGTITDCSALAGDRLAHSTSPHSAVKAATARSTVRGVQGFFYQSDAVIKARVNIDELVTFLVMIDRAVHDYFQAVPVNAGQDLTLVVGIKPLCQSRFWLDFTPDGQPQELNRGLCRKLDAIEPPKVHQGPIFHATHWSLWGGAPRRGGFRLIPNDWMLVHGGGKLSMLDDLLPIIWPS